MTTVHKLAEALRPFADGLDDNDPEDDDDALADFACTVGDLRRAREALRLLSEAPEPEITDAMIERVADAMLAAFANGGWTFRDQACACLTAALSKGGDAYEFLVAHEDKPQPPPDLIRRAKEIVAHWDTNEAVDRVGWPALVNAIAAFGAAERERAAMIADKHRRNVAKLASNPPQSEAAFQIAAEIRAHSPEEGK